MEQINVDVLLKEHNLKNTKVRRDLFQIFSKAGHPIDAVELTESLKVNKTSIYRELKVLLAKGLILEIDFGDGKKRYELSSLDHHHHLVCTSCKSVSDVQLSKDLSAEEELIEKEKSFKVQRHNLEFFGLCANCQ
jgi:Fe2+ or Zn2+ uptake regulation protein